jgi:transcriptional regulator with XRE-family HTH domain
MSKDIAEALRKAIAGSGKSVNEIAKASGVPQTTLARFMRGYDMTMARGAKVAKYLGLELNPATSGRKQKGGDLGRTQD